MQRIYSTDIGNQEVFFPVLSPEQFQQGSQNITPMVQYYSGQQQPQIFQTSVGGQPFPGPYAGSPAMLQNLFSQATTSQQSYPQLTGQHLAHPQQQQMQHQMQQPQQMQTPSGQYQLITSSAKQQQFLIDQANTLLSSMGVLFDQASARVNEQASKVENLSDQVRQVQTAVAALKKRRFRKKFRKRRGEDSNSRSSNSPLSSLLPRRLRTKNSGKTEISDLSEKLSGIDPSAFLHAYMDSFVKFGVLDLRVFRAFHRAGFDFELESADGETLLHRATKGSNRDQLFRFLINECGVDPNKLSKNGRDTGLHLYIRHGPIYIRTIEAYLDAFPSKYGPFRVNTVNAKRNTVLHELLLHVSRIDVTDELCQTVTRMLIPRRFDFSLKNKNGLSVIALAEAQVSSQGSLPFAAKGKQATSSVPSTTTPADVPPPISNTITKSTLSAGETQSLKGAEQTPGKSKMSLQSTIALLKRQSSNS
ncbi:Hypothetical Protein FCC1311_081822 [Hondaea fermentalgiana]|uniref:Uncharacterized protein n=1 Tax=Hondaea fermentalgiana TaxID=2315210 RepID=A0A2R5GM49_9STRA|nr:Hypothetical Protein FCC1311_081822 [Hondaea fermentalgiana]|eukprot:GBG31957.1 Hypothetical Protein FCC1311_081822 [Hondaea fermentalgiana]